MAKPILTLFFLLFSFSAGIVTLVDGGETWCVAKPSTDSTALEQNLNFACNSGMNCSIFEEGGPCYSPNNLMNHASIAMNLYYQAKGRNYWDCTFGNSAPSLS